MLVSRAPELGEHGDFRSRALVFISQQDEEIQPALREVLSLLRPEIHDVAELTEIISKLRSERSERRANGSWSSLWSAMELHNLNVSCAEHFAGRKLAVLCECLLNYSMAMSEMLTEERCDVLRLVVEIRSCERVAKRFKGQKVPLTDANEHWRHELDDWRALLAPFSWKNSRASVMSQALLAADLCEPLTKHVDLVRSFEYLRCLGGGLIDEEMQSAIKKLQQHGEKYSCWKASEVSEAVLTAYRKSVIFARTAAVLPKDVLDAEATAKARGSLHSAAEAMGFLPSALTGKIPLPVLGHLAGRLLSLAEQEGKAQQDSDLVQKLCRSLAETAQMCKDNISEAPHQLCLNFLLQVGKEYLTRATPRQGTCGTYLNFELLVGTAGGSSMQLLRNLETHPEAQRLLGNMALSELLQVASLIQEAHGMVHGDNLPFAHAGLQRWLARLKVDSSLHPADMSELSAALEDFLKQNYAARIAGQEEALPACLLRVLQRLETGLEIEGDESASAICPAGGEKVVERRRPENVKQKVIACFGQNGGLATSPVVVRCIPIGLKSRAASASTGAIVGREEYEVREVGLRSSGMYRMAETGLSGQGGLLDMLEDATVMQYQWVPPSEVREDSYTLQQILVTATHVHLQLPALNRDAEELLIDLQTSQVIGHSSWYQVLPQHRFARDSADASGGFRRLSMGIGPGLRLPLPRNLFTASTSGVVETAEVLASLLAIWFSQRHSLEDVSTAIRQQPSLVYFTSIGLLERFDELGSVFIQALKKHWSGLLQQFNQSETDSHVVPEVKEILLELLLAGPNDRLAAVLPATHLNDFCSLVKHTKLSLELLAVERFCFEAALERIASFQHSTLTFILIEITGQISALQLSELIRTACGSIRLVFSWYPGLLPKLALTLSLGNVLLPNSLKEVDFSSRSAPTTYRDTFALGQATLACQKMKPVEMSPLDGLDTLLKRDGSKAVSCPRIDWARNLKESQSFLKEAHAWADREEKWRSHPHQPQSTLLLLVASDEALIQQRYAQMDGVKCFRLNHAERQVLAPVESLLDRLAHHGDQSMSSKLPIIVLLGVGFITPSKLEDLVARAYVCGVRVVLVAPEPLAFLRCIRVTTRIGTEYLQATIVHVRGAPNIDYDTLATPPSAKHSSDFMRALQLVLGQVLPSSPPNSLLLAIKAKDPAACGAALAAMPAPAGRQILRADVAADLCAGILHSLGHEGTQSTSQGTAFDTRSLAYATGCLVANFVLRGAAMELDHKVWDLSFTDFRAHSPVCRFLDQVCVLESWCRYLDFVGFQVEPQKVHQAEGSWFWPSQKPERRFLSQWDFENNTHSTGIEDLLEQATARLESSVENWEVPTAAYWGSGPAHQSEDPEEVLERQCLQNRELDWASFSESWRTALDIKPGLFLQLAGLGVDTLRLFLCLPPSRAIELGLTYLHGDLGTPQGRLAAEVTRKLLRDLECVADLLDGSDGSDGSDASELSSRVAAVKWLLTILPESIQTLQSGHGCHMTETEIQELVRSNVMLCPRGRSDLLMRVASMLISLDGIDVLNSQHEIKRFLLETDLPLHRLLSKSGKVGRAVVSLLFCPDHAEQLKRREVGVALASSFEELLGYDVLAWRSLSSGGEAHRLTAAAHAAVLEYAPNVEIVETLLQKPLLFAISKQMTLEGAQSAEGFLCEVLENVPSSDTLVLTILKILSSTDEEVSKVMKPLNASLRSAGRSLLSSSKNPFLPALYSALQSQSLGNYLAMVAHGSAGVGRPLQLSLDSCTLLQDLYIQYFRQSMPEITMAHIESSYAIHKAMLDDASCAALFCKLQKESTPTPSDLALLWYCWSQSPDRQLPFWALPPASSGPIFVAALNTGVLFVERCKPMRFGLSVLAKFLVTPETLPLGVYNTLTEKAPWVHGPQADARGNSTMKVRTLLLGQEDQEEYPPYCIRWHARALPSSLRHQLLRRCHGSVAPSLDTAAHDFYPRVNSGISEASVRFNLGLFLALRSSNPDLQVYFDHGADHQRQFVAGCILCWFKAAGMSYQDLVQCVRSEDQADFKLIWDDVHEAYSRTGPASLRRMYVRGPLPTDIDVRWIDDGARDVPILARTRDSAVLTAQWLNMLLLHFKLPHPEPFETEDLVIESADSGLQSGKRLETALAAISKAVGAALRRDLCAKEPALVIALADGKFDTLQLVTRVTVLADFVLLLRTSTVPSETPMKIGHFFEQLVSALAEEQEGFEPPDANVAALFDAFFLLHGLTSENEGLEMEALAKAYQTYNLPVSAQTMEEVRWLHENYYGRRDKASGSVKCRIPRFAMVCDRIANIQRLQLRKVTFQRHLEKTQFVGELFAQDFDVSPPYLLQSNMQLLCSLPAGNLRKREDLSADLPDEAAARHDLQLDEGSPAFFAEVGSDGRSIGSSTRTYGRFDWPDLRSLNASDWKGTCPVISAGDVVQIVSEPAQYLHAALRVRPGLEPVLWHSSKSQGFFRLSSVSKARTIDGIDEHSDQGDQVWKAFATNAEAWQFIDQAPSPVLAMDGSYLRKAEDQSWVMVFPTSRDPSEPPVTLGDLTLRSRRYLLWPLCHSHKLVNLSFSPEALRVLQLLVSVAWQMCLGTQQKNDGLAVEKALMELSATSNKVEQQVSMQDLPESDEELVAEVRKLQQYQQNERFLAEVLLRILWKMKSQQRDDLGGLIREESLRRWATMQVPFVHQEEPHSLSSLGRVLQRLLVPIGSKAGIVGSPMTTQAWTQLELMLEACYRGEHLPRERCLAKHIHVTKSGFAKRGVAILQSIYHAQLDCRQPPTVQHLSDSEDDAPRPAEKNGSTSPQRRSFVSQAKADKVYVDTPMDRDPAAGSILFERQVGHGRPLSSKHAVMTFYDEDLPLYYIQLDRQRLKVSYSSSDGLCLGYLVHKNVLAELLEDATTSHSGSDGGLQLVRSLRMKFLPWIVDVLRSPLPSDTKTWILRCCERMGMVAVAPYQEPNHVNLAIMAFSLCRCCPAGSDAALFLRSVLMNAWHIPEEVKHFVERKSDVYGVYVVKPGTLQRIQELGLRVAVRDFEREVWQRSLDNSAMYLDIISHFSSYCCFTYVKGLKKLDDILLKWLAEYTRLHPWRFVYLEGVDTSFNFPENRDRCNFRFAPANPLHSVRSMDDLKKLEVSQVRPSHFVSYAARTQPAEELQDSRRLLAFFAKNFAPDSSTGSLAADAMHQDTMFSQSPPASSYSPDFRRELEDLLFGPLPCMILLVSAPGAGKTHHMSALRGRLEEEMQFDIHEFDGSSDILVTTALAEVLQRTMTSQSMQSQKLLILDEYHMLSDEHKDELFEWVRAKLGSELRVVLIANRSDSKDRERLEQIRPTGASQVKVALLQTRLSRLRIQQVMESRGNAERWRPAICDWLVASRLLFGEESVSLRLCDTLEALLESPEPRGALIELLLHRVPTVSRTSAVDFVDAYLQHEGFRRKTAFGNTLLGFCFRVAMQDVQSDELCSFVEFLSLTPKAHEAPPAVRLLAWACYVMNAKKTWDLNGLAAMWSKRHLFVDQVNFPFELAEEALGYPTGSGPTFSWAGDPSSMRDLVDAVRRGHSVDWAEVHRKVWSVEHIKDSELFAQLLSLSRNPGMILQQVLPSNLCSLLRLSNTAAPTAVQLARIILQNAPVDSNTSSQVDRPRCLSLWTVILHDQQDLNCVEVLRLAGGPSALLEALLWARDWATERRSTAQAQARTRLLQQLLALMSCCCRSPIGANSTNECKLPLHQLILLWTGSFGCLLKAATPQQEKVWKKRELESGGAMSAEFLVRGDLPPALPQKRLCEVLQRVADVQADWPQEVRLLWRVLHSRSTAREVSKLWVAAPYMLQDTSSEAESAPIHEIFIPGVVAASGTLSRSLQRCLLCNSCQVPQKVSAASFVAACADALNELRNADQLREVQVAGPGGAAIQRLVREEQER